ncbi:hypothetical protein TL16_g08295 [Triparma laevis f. inornata]|uniref:Uncharacterized protein n=1 Tax=Triparma laevis f. inornata TaxID=1714386 RepID=A0A9W7B2E0_9STRA|nr:hypothetical protein TL16_g08295 [Triparma laevis f. inornata]
MAETAKSAFASVDTAGVGKVETSSLPLLLSALNAPLTVPMDDLLALLDRTGTGLIFSDDFINWYTSTTSGPSIDDLSVGASSMSTNLNDLTADQLFNKVEQVARLANKTSSSDIHEAAWNNDINLIKRYISIESSLANSIDDTEFGSSYRPLHYASYNGHYEIYSDTLPVRLYKIKVVSLPTGSIIDLLIVPRTEWMGGVEESVIVRNNIEAGGSYAVYVSGVNGMGFGEYSDMSEVVGIKEKKSEEDRKEEVKRVKKVKKPESKTLQAIDVGNSSSTKKKKKKSSKPKAMTLPVASPVAQGPGSGSSDESSELDFGALEPDRAVDLNVGDENLE